ncbi:hypothetical protein OC846_002537 [Tilletia horrida]|uniref:Ricin B lectin domain-containing protein n=1 Tax=Tilletia horrida TaxID=155126 RepID=A0AAN6GTH1_9BASI|nr:hypothetical protein OC846_002537 [Tilletia horrida]
MRFDLIVALLGIAGTLLIVSPVQARARNITCSQDPQHSGAPFVYFAYEADYYVDTSIAVRDAQGLQALPINRNKKLPQPNGTPPSLVFYSCNSTFMGYKTTDTSITGGTQTETNLYGQVRVKGGRCLEVSQLYSTKHQPLVLGPCYTTDDAGVLRQFFRLRIIRSAANPYHEDYASYQLFFVGNAMSNNTAANYLFTNGTLNNRETLQLIYKPTGASLTTSPLLLIE